MGNLIKNLSIKRRVVVALCMLFMLVVIVGINIALTKANDELVPQDLKLKAPIEKIWKHEVVRDIRCDKEFKCRDFGEMVKYTYISDREAVAQTLGEVLPDSALQKNNISLSEKNLMETERDYNVQRFKLDDNKTLSVFYVGVPFIKETATSRWFYSEVATTTAEAFSLQTRKTFAGRVKSVLFGTALATDSTFYPDPHTESTSVDGWVERSVTGANEAFTTLRGGNGTGIYDDWTDGPGAGLYTESESDKFAVLRAGVFVFDTSSIPDGDTIVAGTLSLYGVGNLTQLGAPDAHICAATTANNAALTSTDYQNRSHTSFASIANASWSSSAYNDFSLDSNGIANISKVAPSTGNTLSKFSLQLSWDVNNSFGGTWASANASIFPIYFAEQTGTANDPKLAIVHTALKGYKDVDEPRASTTTLQNDSNLEATLEANKTYVVEGLLFATAGSAAPDLKIGFTVPTGAVMDIAYVAHNSNDIGVLESSGTAGQQISLTANDKEIIQISGTVKTSSTAGTLHLQWAQNTSNVASTTLQAGSFLRVIEIQT